MQSEPPRATALVHIMLLLFGLALSTGAMLFWHYLPALCTAANDAREALLG